MWKTKNAISVYDDTTGEYVDAEVGDIVTMKATIKEHSEYKGTKQTVITRPKIVSISKNE